MLGEPIWQNPALYFRIGFCPEQDAFYERMTGLEWVTALVRLNGVSDAEARAMAARALEAVELTDAADKKIGAYSKGMRQRVKLAQALAHDPELLILDEPLSGMDPIARRKTIRLIKDWGRAGKSVIVSSHILHEIESMTSNILLINQGRILAEGNVHQIRDLIDEHPHTVHIQRRPDARARARVPRRTTTCSASSSRTGRSSCRRRRPDAFYCAADRARRLRRARHDSRGHLARRQPAGGLPVSGEVMTSQPDPRRSPRRACSRRPLRIFDLSLGQMLWSRRSVFLGVLLGGPVVLAVALRIVDTLHASGFRVNGAQVGGPAIFGMMIWLLYIRFIVPVLGVFYGTSLIADEVDDKTITYLFTRPIPRGAVLLGKYLAYLVCTTLLVLPSVVLVYFLIVPARRRQHRRGVSVAAGGPRHAGGRAGGLRRGLRARRRAAQAAAGRRAWSSRSAGNRPSCCFPAT